MNKDYRSPEFDVLTLLNEEVIVCSLGTNTETGDVTNPITLDEEEENTN